MSDGRMSSGRAAGGLLVALGTAMVVVAMSGDSLFYVRGSMTVPLIVTGMIVVFLGAVAITGLVVPVHAPRSILLIAVAALFVLVVRPGPLSVEAGLSYDAEAGGRVQHRFEIPPSSMVGVDADARVVAERAVELHAGEVFFAIEQFSDVFDQVAVRMIGQLDLDAEDGPRLVRFRITCCAADALRLTIDLDLDEALVDGAGGVAEQADWVELTGQWDGAVDRPAIEVSELRVIDVPERPYLTLRDD